MPSMEEARTRFDALDRRIAGVMAEHGHRALRVSLAFIFIWFGALKPFRVSPADELVARTVFWIDPNVFLPVLGVWEVAIGLFLLSKPLVRLAILLLFLQMPGTFLPLVLLPEVTWSGFLVPTIEGQYIVKNLILISAALVVGGTVREDARERAGHT